MQAMKCKGDTHLLLIFFFFSLLSVPCFLLLRWNFWIIRRFLWSYNGWSSFLLPLNFTAGIWHEQQSSGRSLLGLRPPKRNRLWKRHNYSLRRMKRMYY